MYTGHLIQIWCICIIGVINWARSYYKWVLMLNVFMDYSLHKKPHIKITKPFASIEKEKKGLIFLSMGGRVFIFDAVLSKLQSMNVHVLYSYYVRIM